MDTLDTAKRVLEIEIEAIRKVQERLGESFRQAVEILYGCEGKIVVVGMGKSGLVGGKIAATLASTGSPSFFLHAAEAAHGDLGMVYKHDVVLVISNSGETDETLSLLPALRRMGLKIVAITGSTESSLGRVADAVLDTHVEQEACPLGLAPTASTTAQLAMGDALAVTLLERRGFNEADFARVHPAGSLGKRLLIKVSDLMHGGEDVARVKLNSPMTEVLLEMSAKRMGTTTVENEDGQLQGIVTDGDLRRAMQNKMDFSTGTAADLMTTDPKTIPETALASRAAHIMEQNSISCVLVYKDDPTRVTGMLHLHDLLHAGII